MGTEIATPDADHVPDAFDLLARLVQGGHAALTRREANALFLGLTQFCKRDNSIRHWSRILDGSRKSAVINSEDVIQEVVSEFVIGKRKPKNVANLRALVGRAARNRMHDVAAQFANEALGVAFDPTKPFIDDADDDWASNGRLSSDDIVSVSVGCDVQEPAAEAAANAAAGGDSEIRDEDVPFGVYELNSGAVTSEEEFHARCAQASQAFVRHWSDKPQWQWMHGLIKAYMQPHYHEDIQHSQKVVARLLGWTREADVTNRLQDLGVNRPPSISNPKDIAEWRRTAWLKTPLGQFIVEGCGLRGFTSSGDVHRMHEAYEMLCHYACNSDEPVALKA